MSLAFTYPTVVMVTKAHQNPCQDPWIKDGGKSSGLLDRSCVMIGLKESVFIA